VLNLAAIYLLLKGKKVSLYFSNEYIMKRDIGIFKGIYEGFPKENYRFESKQVKGFSPFKKGDLNPKANIHILVDEIDATFFKDMQNMALMGLAKASGVTATA